ALPAAAWTSAAGAVPTDVPSTVAVIVVPSLVRAMVSPASVPVTTNRPKSSTAADAAASSQRDSSDSILTGYRGIRDLRERGTSMPPASGRTHHSLLRCH